MSWIPPQPDLPATQRATGRLSLRFEDVSQDGRMMIEALPQAIGDVVWAKLLDNNPLVLDALRAGIVPILSRSVSKTGGGPIALAGRVQAEACYQLAHTVGRDGAVNRLVLNMWSTVTGVVGRTYGVQPPNAGEPVEVGRIFAEHVLTRPFGDPASRKVLTLRSGEAGFVPPVRQSWRAHEDVLALPEGAVALDEGLALDATPICFGLDHTDSNQHVNSLVYPRLFFEAALRRLALRDRPTRLALRGSEIAFRKPCFAGERARIAIRAYEHEGSFGVAGVLVSEEDAGRALAEARPRCYVRMLLAAPSP